MDKEAQKEIRVKLEKEFWDNRYPKPPLVDTYAVIADNSSHHWAVEIWAHYEQEFNWIAEAQREVDCEYFIGESNNAHSG